jgi:hypothetical protein
MDKEEDDGISFRPWKGDPQVFQPALEWTETKLKESYKKFQLHAPTELDRFSMYFFGIL